MINCMFVIAITAWHGLDSSVLKITVDCFSTKIVAKL